MDDVCPSRCAEPPAFQVPDWMAGLLAAAAGLSVANVYYAQPLLDALAAEFGLGAGQAGWVVTATQAGSALALLLLVPLGDLVNRRRLALAQLLLLCLALAAVGAAGSVVGLLAGMLAVGLLGTAMTQGIIASAAAWGWPEARGRVVGTVQGGVMVGLLLARVLAGSVADLAGWRAVYLGAALLMLLLAMAMALWRALPHTGPAVAGLSYLQLLGSMGRLLARERVLQVRGVLALLMFAALSIFWSAVALPLSGPPYHLSHTAIGALGLVGVLGALAAGRAGRWADQGLAQRTTGVALGLLILSWGPLALMPWSLWALLAGVVLLDMAAQAIHVTNQSLVFSVRPEASGRLVGCYMLFYAAGSGAGAIASTQVYAMAGWMGVCGLGAAVSTLALIFWRVTLRR